MVSPSRFFILKGWANVQMCQITQEKGINSKVSSLKSNTQSTQEARYNQSSDYISENVFPKLFLKKKKKLPESSLSCVISPSLLGKRIVILSCKVSPHYRGLQLVLAQYITLLLQMHLFYRAAAVEEFLSTYCIPAQLMSLHVHGICLHRIMVCNGHTSVPQELCVCTKHIISKHFWQCRYMRWSEMIYSITYKQEP